ncbi:transcriptional repressor [Paenibacillus lycopersici]|uniref:Transcriptional repressor n=1 Tax=Paenibacillus lycopersici TaxID=2704462 RepID=A0A6C0FPP5_9BACL|nr:Fur family transcriptional regulator [Paenibacillus lycopersici]QHT59098.1 transcriptional repressor [Paenibacillus lycopersici]
MAVIWSKESIVARMKEEGLRITPQRIQVVELLLELPHPTADRIYEAMVGKFPHVSPTTVYSTLKLLIEIGIARELANGSKSSRFELAETDHWHFRCRLCGRLFNLEPDNRESLMAAGTDHGRFQVDGCRVEFYGVCAMCRE